MSRALYIIRSQLVSGGPIEDHWRLRDLERVKKMAQRLADRLGPTHKVWIDGEVKTTKIEKTQVNWSPK